MSGIVQKINHTKGFSPVQQALFARFEALGIVQTTYEHPAIFTVEEGIKLNLPALIPGRHGKSLFLTTAKGDLWLVVACEDTRVDLKKLAQTVDAKRFSFARPERMIEILGVTPGSATPFALMNDSQKQVRVILDKAFLDSAECVFHPLDNRYSTVISVHDLVRFIEDHGYKPLILSVG